MKTCAGEFLNFIDNLVKEAKDGITTESPSGLIAEIWLIQPLFDKGIGRTRKKSPGSVSEQERRLAQGEQGQVWYLNHKIKIQLHEPTEAGNFTEMFFLASFDCCGV